MNLDLTKYLAHKKHTNLIFAACDDKYAFCLYISLSTLQENSPRLAQSADIYVAGYGLSDKSKEILNSLPHTRVVDYAYPAELPDTEQIRKFTAASFARYDCFALLKHYEKILYLDSDVLVQKEILPVFDEIYDGLGLITDPTFPTVRGQFFAPIKGFNMERVGFNSGFLVLTNKSNWAEKGEEITRWLYEQTQKLAKDLFLPDQGIINLAIEHFAINPAILSDLYNCPASESISKLKKAYIIHSTGPRKFWNYYFFRDFYKYYTVWIKKGGAPVAIRKGDSKLYKKFLANPSVRDKIFFQLCPDIFSKPLKALRFSVKKMLKVRF